MKSIDIGTMFLVKGELDVATEEPEFMVERMHCHKNEPHRF